MAIEIICDDCGNKYRVGDDKAGTRVRCKECGSKIEVPDEDFERELGSRPRRSRKSGDGTSVGVIIGVGAVALVLVIGVVLYIAMSAPRVDVGAQANALPNSNPGGAPAIPQPSPQPASTLPTSTPNPGARVEAFPGVVGPGPQVGGNTPPANVAALPQTKPTTPANALPGTGLPTSTNRKPPVGPRSTRPVAKTEPARPADAPNPVGPASEAPVGFAASNDPALDLPPPDNWNVKVDPAKIDHKIDESKTVNLKIPKGGEFTDVVYPATPSPFVAIGNNSNAQNVREIWNLATKQKTGSITGGVIDRHGTLAALSPNGQHFASGMGSRQKNGVIVFPAKGNKSLGELDAGGDTWGIAHIAFTSPERLFALNANGSARTWKIPSGEVEHELQLGDAKEPFQIAISPGGKYLAAVTAKNSLQVFDLDSAEIVGELSLPSGDNFWEFKTDAMSFSPDGVELGLTGEVFTKGKFLLRYNVANGKLLAKAPLNLENVRLFHADRVKTNRLEWFPDRGKLLWKGHCVLDAQLGGPVWNAPEEDGSSEAPRKLLDSKRILIAYGGRQNPGIKTAPISMESIDAAAKVVAAGGAASDAGLPTLSKSDYDTMIALAPVAANWSMQPDPAPVENTVKNSISLPKERPSVGGVYISRPSVNRALIWYTGNNGHVMQLKGLVRHVNLPQNLADTCLIEAYDLAKGGKAIASLPLNYKSSVLHASLDGEHIVAKTTHPKDDRVDVYNVIAGKHVAGWRPFQQKDDHFKGVTGALLLDGEYCLTLNEMPFQPGSAIMWKLPECKAVWRIKGASNFCVSPGGKYLGFLAESRFLFMEARTGELVGELPVTMPTMSCAFHPMGTHLAILASDSTRPTNSYLPSNAVSRKLAIVDVATGKTTTEFYLPQGNDTVQWCGDEHVLVDNMWLVDLKQQKNGWRYLLESGVHAKTQPDGRHWYVSNLGGQDQSITLSSATIPEKSVAEKINATNLPDEALLKPGMPVYLNVNLASALPPDRPNLATEVGTAFEAGLRKHGFQIDQNASYTYTITSSQMNTGKNMEFNRAGTVPIIEVKCEVALMSNGQPVWKHTQVVSNAAFAIWLQQGEDATTHLSKQMWGHVTEVLTKFPVPGQVFGGTAGAGLGQSKFTIGGVQPIVGR